MTATSFPHFSRISCFALLMAAALGCGSREPRGEVAGEVALDSKPVGELLVIFRNVEKGVHITADVQSDGRFRVVTEKGGLPTGDYEVYLGPPLIDLPPGPIENPQIFDESKLPQRYRKPETSGVRITVVPGENRLKIDMTTNIEKP